MQTKEFFSEGETVCVLTSQPIDRLLDYRAPAGGCRLRAFVEVPLGPRKVLGVVDPEKVEFFVNTVHDLSRKYHS